HAILDRPEQGRYSATERVWTDLERDVRIAGVFVASRSGARKWLGRSRRELGIQRRGSARGRAWRLRVSSLYPPVVPQPHLDAQYVALIERLQPVRRQQPLHQSAADALQPERGHPGTRGQSHHLRAR